MMPTEHGEFFFHAVFFRMDRRLGADYYSFVSPIVDLREFLEEAHAAKQTMEGEHWSCLRTVRLSKNGWSL